MRIDGAAGKDIADDFERFAVWVPPNLAKKYKNLVVHLRRELLDLRISSHCGDLARKRLAEIEQAAIKVVTVPHDNDATLAAISASGIVTLRRLVDP